jgi:hypothetical protein
MFHFFLQEDHDPNRYIGGSKHRNLVPRFHNFESLEAESRWGLTDPWQKTRISPSHP